MEQTAQSPAGIRWLLIGLVAVLLGTAFWVRVDRGHVVVAEDAILFRDNDTARRLARLDALAAPEASYPLQNPHDGAPDGTVIHWTLPMDWVIQALDPLVSWGYPQAERYQAGAIWADVLLGTAAVLAFALLSMRWLGPWVGLLATALYAFSFPAVHITLYGIGDHQALQHLCLVVALLGFCCLLWQKAGARMAWAVGAALGLALWVSTESSIALYLMCFGAFAHLLLLAPGERRAAVLIHLRWTVACLAVAFVGDRFEHPGALLTFEWDQVSGFWLYQILVFAVFLGSLLGLLPRRRDRWSAPLIAAGGSVLLGVVVLFVTGLSTALAEQMELFRGANRWTQNTVEEYRALVVAFGKFHVLLAPKQLNWLILGIPLWIFGCAKHGGTAAAARMPVLGMTAGLFLFACLEMKVSHLFVVLYPWLLVTGGGWWIDRFAGWMKIGEGATRAVSYGAGALAVLLLFGVPGRPDLPGLPPRQSELNQSQLDIRELTEALIALREANGTDEMSSVLAHWTWGAKLMYYADAPAVATGYHRNLSGIEDSYRVLAGMRWEDFEPILRARKVRWIVSVAENNVFAEVHTVVPSMPELMVITDSQVTADGVRYEYRLSDAAEVTLQMFLTTWRPETPGDPHFELVWNSSDRAQARHPDGTMFMQPRYRIWRVIYPGEQ